MRILHLEDNPTDAEFVRQLLHGEWSDCTIEVVSTRPAFLAALKVGGHQVIISDFTLVNFNGLEALELTRELRPDVPFIFFTGTLGEDRAIDAVHDGAYDYVLKDHLKRLVTAVKRGLRGSEECRSRRAAPSALVYALARRAASSGAVPEAAAL